MHLEPRSGYPKIWGNKKTKLLIKITFPFVTYGFSYLSPPTRPTGQTATLLVNLICKKLNCGII